MGFSGGMFQLLLTVGLFSSAWPLITINDDPENSGNGASTWNTYTDFGGGPYRTIRGGGSGGMYGKYGVRDKSYDSLIGMVTTPEGDPPPSHPMRLSAPGGPTLPA